MRIASLFSGIGGFDLAARWMGWSTAWYSEVDPFASRVMAAWFPEAVNHGDIRTIRGVDVEPVDLICGGFPCQDISIAGKGAGITGARSGLWSEYARLIGEIHPRWVVAENVSALRSRGLGTVLKDLDALGYDAEWHCIPASAVGAPHQRDRIWIVAYPQRGGLFRPGLPSVSGQSLLRTAGGGGRGADSAGVGGPAREAMANPQSDRRREERAYAGGGGEGSRTEGHLRGGSLFGGDDPHAFRDRLEGLQQAGSAPWAVNGSSDGRDRSWWATEPDVGRVAHGVPARVDRLGALGNALVPRLAYGIFRMIARASVTANVAPTEGR